MKKLFLIFLLLIPLTYAVEPFDYQTLDLNLKISNSLMFNPTSSSYHITSADIELSWFPREDYRQEVVYLNTEPNHVSNEEILSFNFKNPQIKADFNIDSNIKTSSEYLPITKKVDFPVKIVDPYLTDYLEEHEIIDFNSDIEELAFSLSDGKNDLFEVEYSFAEWIRNNIEYDLNTITSEAAQKSSWVLDNRYGVCDELTSLFISFNREVGIPARFVSGIAYTNIESFENPWGAHGWAEVYFPKIGWVPFDVTYEQYGWVDAGHIKLKTAFDAGTSSVDYNAIGKNFKLEGSGLESEVNVNSFGNIRSNPFSLSIDVNKDNIGFGSFNLITVNIKNNKDYYVVANINLGNTQNIDYFDESKRFVLLKPRETKKEYFIIKINNDLDNDYVYTFPIKVYANNENSSVSFTSDFRSPDYDYNYFKELIPTKEELSIPVSVNCEANYKEIKLGEKVEVKCDILNKQSSSLRWLNICLDQECYNHNLESQEQISQTFVKEIQNIGLNNLEIKISHDDFEIYRYAMIRTFDNPKMIIDSFEFPETINYEEEAEFIFSVKQDSYSIPKNIKVVFEAKYFSEEWIINNASLKQQFIMKIPGNIMNAGENNFKVKIYYTDNEEKQYQVEEIRTVKLINVSSWQKVKIWFNQLSLKIDQWF